MFWSISNALFFRIKNNTEADEDKQKMTKKKTDTSLTADNLVNRLKYLNEQSQQGRKMPESDLYAGFVADFGTGSRKNNNNNLCFSNKSKNLIVQ